MKTNVINILRLFILILPVICLPIFIIMGVKNISDETNVEPNIRIIRSVKYSELNALNPIKIDDVVVDINSSISTSINLEAEESNKTKEETSAESIIIDEIEESIAEESSEPEEPKHTMGVESLEHESDYSDTTIEGNSSSDFVYYSKYYDERDKSWYSIPLSYEHQQFAYNCCVKYGVPYEVMMGLWGAEASWNINIGVTRDTYYGIGQIHIGYNKDYIKTYGVDLCTPLGGLEGSVILIRDKIYSYGGDINKALMAYNCGDYGASRLWSQGVYNTHYTRKILSIANNLKEGD